MTKVDFGLLIAVNDFVSNKIWLVDNEKRLKLMISWIVSHPEWLFKILCTPKRSDGQSVSLAVESLNGGDPAANNG